MAVTVAIIGRLGFFFFFFVRFAEQRHLPSLLENVENIGKKFQNFSSKRLLISIFPHMLIRSSGYVSTFLLSLIILFISQDLIVPLSIFHREYQVLIVSLRLITREKRRLSNNISNNNRSHVPKSIVQYLSIKLYNSTIFNFSNYNLDNRDEIRREFL